MKKALSASLCLFSLFICLLSLSCSEKASLLEYQKGDFTLSATLYLKESGNEYEISVSKSCTEGTLTLCFEQGQSLDTVSFVMKDNKVSAFCGGDSYGEGEYPLIHSALSLFDLKEEDFISAETDTAGQTRLNLLTFKNGVSLTFAKDVKLPLILENGEVRIKVRV